jgi:hypothetical protein
LTIYSVSEGDDAFSVRAENGTGFIIEKKLVNECPKVGDKVSLYLVNGSIIRGMSLNGVLLFYKSDLQLEQERQEWLTNYKKEKQEKFEENKYQMDSDYESLPPVFKQRIDRFRKHNPDFRVDYEAYELFCCKEAVKIADACKTTENIEEFKKGLTGLVPNLDKGHSGNTFDMACGLARLYIESPEFVTSAMGSLAPLVGSKEYGDL